MADTVNATLTASGDQVVQLLMEMNANLKQMAEGSKKVGDEGEKAAKKQETAWEKTKDIAGKVVSNYMNIVAIVGDVIEVYEEAYKRQSQWNALLTGDAYKKYSDQINNMTEATGGMIDAYTNVSSLQKLFAAGVDLSGGKLEQLSRVAAEYAQRMGVDASEALQRFNESIAEGNVSKLEDLGIYIDLEKATMDYAIANGVAAKELDDASKKQIVLNEALKLAPDSTKKLGNEVSNLSGHFNQLKQNVDSVIVAAGRITKGAITQQFEEFNDAVINAVENDYVKAFVKFTTGVEIMGPKTAKAIELMTNSTKKFSDSLKETADNMQNFGRQGALTFQGLIANNIDAINKDLEAKKKAAAEYKKMLEWDKEQAKKEADITREIAKQQETDDYAKQDRERKKSLDKVAFDEKVKQTELKNEKDKQERARVLAREELLLDSELYNQKADLLKDFNTGKLITMNLTAEQIKAMSLDEIKELLKSEENKYASLNDMAQKGGQILIDASNNLYSQILSNQDVSLKQIAAMALQQAGAQIFADGITRLWQGGGDMLKFSNPAKQTEGAEQFAYGLAEIGAGLALGYAGKEMMPSNSGSSSESKSKETAAADRNSTKDNQKQKMDVYLYPDEKQWLRSLNKSNNKLGVQRGK